MVLFVPFWRMLSQMSKTPTKTPNMPAPFMNSFPISPKIPM